MSSVFDALGIDEEDLEWQDLALCQGMPTRYFYDDYETNEEVAKMVDDACLSCPVMAQCLRAGIENSEWGCWGGFYLQSGTVDENRNRHKTDETREQFRKRLSG